MRLLEKRIKTIKHNKTISYYTDCVFHEHNSMRVRIKKLKEIIAELSETRKTSQTHERIVLCDRIMKTLKIIEDKYELYMLEYYDLDKYLKESSDLQTKNKIIEKANLALHTKVEIREDFETIYRNFKNMAKRLNNIPMEEILTRIREVFEKECNIKPKTRLQICYPSW